MQHVIEITGWIKGFFLTMTEKQHIDRFPDSYTVAPVKMVYAVKQEFNVQDVEVPLNFCAGFTAALEKDLIVRPQMSLGFRIDQ